MMYRVVGAACDLFDALPAQGRHKVRYILPVIV